MEGSSNKKQQATDAVCGGKPARPHWRRRDPADTAVYVVPPTQFRTVVQQLTGAADSPPAPVRHHHQSGRGTTAPKPHQAAAGGTSTNAAQQQHGGGAGSGRTLGQMQQECMAWANSEDD